MYSLTLSHIYIIVNTCGRITNQTELESSNTSVQSLLNSPNPNHQVGTKATTAVISARTAFCECEEIKPNSKTCKKLIVQELCESQGGRPELSVLTSLLVSVDVKNY